MNNSEPKRVLIIEDEATIAQMYKIKLELAGYRVALAYDGAKSLEIIKRARPDLILLDIMMPHVNGDQVLKEIRADAELAHLPVIILTNVGDKKTQNEMENLGVADYLQKSDLTPEQVLARIDAVLD